MNATPNFFVIGVAKGGTTSLHHYLSQHPEIYLTPIKETNHFASDDIDEGHLDPVYARDIQLDIDAYISQGMKRMVHIAHVHEANHYKSLYSKVSTEKAVGEISNSYIACPSAVPNIKAQYPEAKLLVLLRNPIERAWSHYLMNVRESKTTHNDFLAEVLSDNGREHKGWGVSHQYVELGWYASQMKRVLQHFPKNQVKWVLFEEFKTNPQASLAEICAFLGVDSTFEFDLNNKANEAGIPRHDTVNRLLVRSGLIHKLKASATTKQKEWVKSVLFKRGASIPKMGRLEQNQMKNFYKDEVAELSQLLQFDFNAYWNL